MSGEVRPPETSAGRSRFSPQAILILVGLTVLALFGLSAFLPRWWSHRIGDQVHGSFSSGIGLGLFYGFVFTLIPLAIAWFALGRMSNWKRRLIALGLAVLVAGPNLLTLSIALGVGNAAHAGERTLDVEAPGFRTSSAIGAVVAVLAIAMLALVFRSRRRSRADVEELKAQLEARKHDA